MRETISLTSISAFSALFAATLLHSGAAIAGDAEKAAMDLVDSTIAQIEQDGINATVNAINEGGEPYIQGELYVFVITSDGIIVGHPAYPELRGMSFDVGMMLSKEATEEGSWVQYEWKNPVSGETEDKSSWARVHNGYIVGAGVYKK